ncbi:O-methyltransferase [Algoriphagus namhaensis]
MDRDIEAYRRDLLRSKEKIKVLDLGAGSKRVNQSVRKISDVTKYSTSGRKFAQIYQYFCSLTPAEKVVELGTCMGISTRYLARVTKGRLYTFEGSSEIQRVAMSGTENSPISFILGDFEDTLPKFLKENSSIDFALIDANHTFVGTISSFSHLLPRLHDRSIVAIGDIHWSEEMEQAWKEIRKHPRVRISLDFYEAGILFFDSPLDDKQDLILSI